VTEEDEPVPLALARVAIGDDPEVFDLPVWTERLGESVGCGVPAEAVDEDLPLSRVGVGHVPDGG
jgi:hypothetical protein